MEEGGEEEKRGGERGGEPEKEKKRSRRRWEEGGEGTLILPSMPKVRKYLRFTLSAIIPLQREEEEEGKVEREEGKKSRKLHGRGRLEKERTYHG